MHKPQEQVRQMHREAMDQPCSPAEPQLRMAGLRAKLILEEALETVVALVGTGDAHAMLCEARHALTQMDRKSRGMRGEP